MWGQSAQQGAFFTGLLWLGAIVGLVAVTVVILMAMRRRYERESGAPASGFSIDQIRSMRERGELDEGEYETLRRMAVEQMQYPLPTNDSRTGPGKEIQRNRRS